MSDTRTREQRMADDGPKLDLQTMDCTRCCKRVDWCTCRHRRRRPDADGIWR